MKALPQNKTPGALFHVQGCVLCKWPLRGRASPSRPQNPQSAAAPGRVGREPLSRSEQRTAATKQCKHWILSRVSGALFKPLVLTGTNQTAGRLKQLRQCRRASLRSRRCSAHRKGLGVWLRQAVFKKVAKMHNLKQLCKDFRVFYQNKCIIQFHFLWSS